SSPEALVKCSNGDILIADTGNNRVRRVEAGTGIVTTVLGDGVAASSGEGAPSREFPVNQPLGLACDSLGNVVVTSTNTIRLLLADGSGVVDGSGQVRTIYKVAPGERFTDAHFLDDRTLVITASGSGRLLQLAR
ncbi:MAG: hypothetical protein KJO07_24145, partial [Deltaproteobacteria bacterium]|nr:hypothetical protein [Deltaproteobacteria bacterium]